MQIFAVLMLGLLATPQVPATPVQANTTPNPGFTLRLSRGHARGEFRKGTQTLIVQMTNTSNEIIREDACSTAGKLYKLIIFYNGVQEDEPE